MVAKRLAVPEALNRLVEAGRWPATNGVAEQQNLTPLATVDRIRSLAPEEDRLFLYPPPFATVAEDIAEHKRRGWAFWQEFGELDQLEPSLALLIGDFGPGSDAPIILDYRRPEPRVLRLAWVKPRNEWRVIAETFEEFVEALGIERP